jgi:hypothetical protein
MTRERENRKQPFFPLIDIFESKSTFQLPLIMVLSIAYRFDVVIRTRNISNGKTTLTTFNEAESKWKTQQTRTQLTLPSVI